MNSLFFPAFLLLMVGVLFFLRSGINGLRVLKEEDIWIASIYVLIAVLKIIGSLAILAAVLYWIVTNLIMKLP